MRRVAPTETDTARLEIWLLESGVPGLIIPSYFLPVRYAERPGRGYCF